MLPEQAPRRQDFEPGVGTLPVYEVMSNIASQCAAEQHESGAVTPGEQNVQDLANCPKETWHKFEIPPFTEECKEEAYWGVTFMMRLHAGFPC